MHQSKAFNNFFFHFNIFYNILIFDEHKIEINNTKYKNNNKVNKKHVATKGE